MTVGAAHHPPTHGRPQILRTDLLDRSTAVQLSLLIESHGWQQESNQIGSNQRVRRGDGKFVLRRHPLEPGRPAPPPSYSDGNPTPETLAHPRIACMLPDAGDLAYALACEPPHRAAAGDHVPELPLTPATTSTTCCLSVRSPSSIYFGSLVCNE
jgi:hypothetical protein